jgi:hypothetical protein
MNRKYVSHTMKLYPRIYGADELVKRHRFLHFTGYAQVQRSGDQGWRG